MPGAIILASGSPRRRELLGYMGLPFELMRTGVDETVADPTPDCALELALRKARAAAEALRPRREGLILAADTIVWCQDQLLGKPADARDAARMLSLIAGRWHEVYTGVCVLNLADGREESLLERSEVHLVPLTGAEIAAYVATGEPMDKAGAYAIQGLGGAFIDEIAGSPSNVMGLPLAQTRALIQRFDVAF
ncbi:MAG: Maf family protein [Clostridia bacterium]|nr:Maf family protein [Clostridia bacterium]